MAEIPSDLAVTQGQPGRLPPFGPDPLNLLGVVFDFSGDMGAATDDRQIFMRSRMKSINTGTVISTVFAVVVPADVISWEDLEGCSIIPRYMISIQELSSLTVSYRICCPHFRIF